MPLNPAEQRFVKRAMRYFGVRRVGFRDTPHGDIAVALGAGPPVIHLGERWRRAEPADRQRRLAHELGHCWGLKHEKKMRAHGYYSNPRRDTLSWRVYDDILRGTPRFDPRRFGLPAARRRYG